MIRRTLLSATALATLALAGCASGAATAPSASPASAPDAGHGAVDGAQEMSEPQSRVLSVSAEGEVGLVDLLSGEESALGQVGAPAGVASDGRFAFVTTADGVDIVDGGAWTWDHGDHFHYYLAEPRVVGSLPGDGAAHVTTPPLSSAGTTGVFFAGSGEAVALDMTALDDGEISERFRVSTGATSGVVAPVGDGALVAVADGPGADTATLYDASGAAGETVACADPTGAVTTRVGTAVACADGALIVTGGGADAAIERVALPDGGALASDFAGRKNRPTVAALADDGGVWLLDTRAAAWTHVDVDAELGRVVAADDAAGHLVAVDAAGAVRVFDEAGKALGSTDPLVEDPAGATLTVDTERAYLTAPGAGLVYEIDYADGARIAREVATPTAPDAAIEVGR
ncbi:ABC transporter [Microbacterium excoecariae]|uniref:ABC transporter n=1 Tax=Microbacterium excoecariae TaxID=2715210 RepID=UPI00140B93A7|nr:ABC transporter [Microbacterium excoecariae]NHI16021.1 ABC transporter [Microbacterium excoecariae]